MIKVLWLTWEYRNITKTETFCRLYFVPVIVGARIRFILLFVIASPADEMLKVK